jgi:septal ring factor EnvC (AmiA/AmiB activator)
MGDSFRLPFPAWLRQILIGLGLFLLGGLISFAYSYRPLHGGLAWQVEELEQRIDARNLENMRLSDELAKLRSSESERVDPESFAEVERDLAKTRTALAQAKKDLDRSERKRKDANASAERWRKRYETLRDEASAAATAAAAPQPARPSEEDGLAGPTLPAAPAPDAIHGAVPTGSGDAAPAP